MKKGLSLIMRVNIVIITIMFLSSCNAQSNQSSPIETPAKSIAANVEPSPSLIANNSDNIQKPDKVRQSVRLVYVYNQQQLQKIT